MTGMEGNFFNIKKHAGLLETNPDLDNDAELLETNPDLDNDARLLEGGLTLDESQTKLRTGLLNEGSWTANTRNYAETLLNISRLLFAAIGYCYIGLCNRTNSK
ncbi:hypothetical protein C1646_754069 [Rhizophagus diaphanus]|nr:hypothetical protein C1646_754069 [Rhizophagus diaphanus] [Rhizophagus sp. MUCL 43196]